MRGRLIKFLKKILGIKSPSCVTMKSGFYCYGKNDFCTDEQKMRNYCRDCEYVDGSGGEWRLRNDNAQ